MESRLVSRLKEKNYSQRIVFVFVKMCGLSSLQCGSWSWYLPRFLWLASAPAGTSSLTPSQSAWTVSRWEPRSSVFITIEPVSSLWGTRRQLPLSPLQKAQDFRQLSFHMSICAEIAAIHKLSYFKRDVNFDPSGRLFPITFYNFLTHVFNILKVCSST